MARHVLELHPHQGQSLRQLVPCSASAQTFSLRQLMNILCNSQEVVPINALVVDFLVILAYPTSIDHVVTSLINFGIKQIVAFLTEVKGCLPELLKMRMTLIHWRKSSYHLVIDELASQLGLAQR